MPAPIELPARAVSGVVMASVAVYAVLTGGIVFACFVVIGAAAGLREWHRLVNRGTVTPEWMISASAVAVATFIALLENRFAPALLALLPGMIAAALWYRVAPACLALFPGSAALSAKRNQEPFWHGLGPLYVGLAGVALVLLRDLPAGAYTLLGIFIAVWTADTGALFGGRLIGGPKLVPRLSPNKTWAGFIAGTIVAGVSEAIYAAVLHGNAAGGLAFGIGIALVGHAGDLFESWVKRKFRVKDSGGLIPGHGGVLDRIDSLLFVAPACALLIMLTGLNPALGGTGR